MKQIDIAIPFGDNCRPAYHLARSGLRVKAYPLDWCTADFKTHIEILKNKYEDFFDNYVEFENTFDDKARFLKDTKYEIQTMHQVRIDLEINDAIQDFKNLIMKRYNRLDNDLKNANTILLVNNQKNLTDEDIKTNINELLEIYPNKEIIFLNVIEGNDCTKRKVQLTDNILLLQCTIIDKFEYVPGINEWDNWVGNIREWEKILADFQLK